MAMMAMTTSNSIRVKPRATAPGVSSFPLSGRKGIGLELVSMARSQDKNALECEKFNLLFAMVCFDRPI
jgi:hypothetical protein